MRRLLAVAIIASAVGAAAARELPSPAPSLRERPGGPALSREADTDTLFLFAASGPGSFGSPGTGARGFTFDNAGEPAAAGWSGVDRTTNEAAWWHVASTAIGAGSGTDLSQAAPFDPDDPVNDHALWCGRYEVCSWSYGQTGYGLSWNQYAIVDLHAMPVQHTLRIDFAYRSSFEGNGYDWFALLVEVDGAWQSVWEDQTELDETYRECTFTLPTAEIGGPGAATRVAFYFHSDGSWCDEDGLFPTDNGAVWVDNLAISVDGEPVFAADFEDGAVPAGLSLEVEPGYGDFAALRRGVAQPEAVTPNETHFWTFFDPALANDDYPDGVIPYGPPGPYNQVESPELTVDQHGAPYAWREGDRVLLEVWVYRDFPPNSEVEQASPQLAAITADGCLQRWHYLHTWILPPSSAGWSPMILEGTQDLLDSADGGEIVGLKVRPCGVRVLNGSGGDHAAGPFLDDVRVYVLRETATAVTTPPAATALLGAQPNPFNPRTTIRFNLAEPGRATLRIYDLAGRHVRTLLDGPAAAGVQTIDWNGRDQTGRQLASGIYVLRFQAGGVTAQRKLVMLQ